MINIGFFPAHPSQLWMMHSLSESAPPNVNIFWYVRDKDIMVELAKELKLDFQLVSKAKTGLLGNAFELFLNIFRFVYFTRRDSIGIWFSKYGSVNIASWMLRKKSFSFNDDDADAVPFIALTSYPFSKNVFCTNWTRMGYFEKYAIRYPSFHELFYLHPNRYTPNTKEALEFLNLDKNEPYVIVRLSSLQAHHDVNAKGVSDEMLGQIVSLLEQNYQVFISSEKPLKGAFVQYKISIPASKIHAVLAGADFVIGDSLTMITEAAVLGTPNLRISSFTGKIGTLNELEKRLLTQSVTPDEDEKIFKILNSTLTMKNKNRLEKEAAQLIEDTIDPIPFIWEKILEDVFDY